MRPTLLCFLVACGGSSAGVDDVALDASPSFDQDAPAPADAALEAAKDAGSLDPSKDGPFAVTEIDTSTKVPATGDTVPIHAVIPAGPGPFPVVVFGHGFQIASSQYFGYVRRLGTFGFLALTADYPAGLTSTNNVRDAKNLLGGLDWAIAAHPGKTAMKHGMMGHSRGGKAAVLAASMDARVGAVLGVDPVDVKPPLPCNAATECPDAREALAKTMIPSAFLGETTDATSSQMACAPAAGNFATFYAKANPPSLAVTLAGANHVSFVADPQSCGFACAFCNPASTPQASVLDLAYALPVAFFGKRLRGEAGWDPWLTNATVTARWPFASVQSK